MASNYTTNYQLNQWEPTDPVLRTDFNADNAKLDAALNELSITADGTRNLAHLVYDLAMKDYAATDYHGFRRGLLMDTLKDQSCIDSLSGDLVYQSGALVLTGAGKSGAMTSLSISVGLTSWSHVMVWVKYNTSGTRSASVNGTPLGLTGRWSTRTTDGISCQEAQFEGDMAGTASANIALSLSSGAGTSASIYEYGAMFF